MTPEQTLDWLAQQHWEQCREERPIQDWIRKMKSQLPKQPEQEPVANVVLREGSPTLLRESDIKPTDKRLYTTPPQPKQPEQEPVEIYQYQMGNGSWIDQDQGSYRYNKQHGHTVRIVYSTPPQPKQPQTDALKLADELDSEFVQGRISNHTGRKAAQMLRALALGYNIEVLPREL